MARNFLLKMSCNFFWISNQLPNNFPIGEKFWIEVKSRRGKEEEKMAEQGKDVSFVGRISQISMKLFINTESRSLWLFEGVSLTFLRWETFACWIELVAVSRNLRKRSWIGRRSCTYSSKFTVKIYNKFLQRLFYWSFYLFWFLAFYSFSIIYIILPNVSKTERVNIECVYHWETKLSAAYGISVEKDALTQTIICNLMNCSQI